MQGIENVHQTHMTLHVRHILGEKPILRDSQEPATLL